METKGQPPPTHGVVERGIEPHELQQVLQDLLWRPGHHQVPEVHQGRLWHPHRHDSPHIPPREGSGKGQQCACSRRDGDGQLALSPAAPHGGRLAAASLQVLLQHQHHLPVLLQAHGVGFHVLNGESSLQPGLVAAACPPQAGPWAKTASSKQHGLQSALHTQLFAP